MEGDRQIQVSSPEVLEGWRAQAASNCGPLYIKDAYLFDGFDASTKNATATFIEFSGRHFACTCRHVVEIVNERRENETSPFPTLSLGLKRGFIDLSWYSVDGLRDAMTIVPGGPNEEHLDLAIADISGHWQRYSAEWGSQAIKIDEDTWREPRWAKAEFLTAAGWPEVGKRNVNVNGLEIVRGSMTLVIAEVSPAGLSKGDEILLMESKLKQPHGWFFSGMSGGPMYIPQDDLMIPAGLLYRGWPQDKDDRSKDYTPNDIVIRGVVLTPSNFKGWLSSAKLI
jgi:hypothetical protein